MVTAIIGVKVTKRVGHFKTIINLIFVLLIAQLLLCIVITAASNTEKKPHQSGLSIIADFLQKFIKPYLRSTNAQPKLRTDVGIKKDKVIEELITKKVEELKHLLDDKVDKLDTEDKLTLRGNNETTLIEFLPKTDRKNSGNLEIIKTILKPDPLKSTINKYKALRDKIDAMLRKENVSEETKTLIIKTLDDMIAHLIESQCIWTLNNQQTKNHNDTKDSLVKVRNMTKKQWKDLRKQYVEYLTNRVEKENAFINQFHNFFSNVLNDTDNLGDRYKIRCQLVQIDKEREDKAKSDDKVINNPNGVSKALLREKTDITKSIQNSSVPEDDKSSTTKQCATFTLCSSELREFFIHFYDNLNDTTVNTFKNYASMYVKDVNTDLGVDKHVVVSIINNIGTTAELKVKDIYKKELKKFKLDRNKSKSANMEHITKFIKKTVSKTKKAIKNKLIDKIEVIKAALFLTVKEDLMVNIEVDLDNLEKQYKETFCSIFGTCNGRYAKRRLNDPWIFRPRSNNEIFVKVQLSLDDDMKNAALKSGLVKMFMEPHHKKYRVHKNNKKTHLTTKKDIIITRTTMMSLRKDFPANANDSISHNKTDLIDKRSKENEIINV